MNSGIAIPKTTTLCSILMLAALLSAIGFSCTVMAEGRSTETPGQPASDTSQDRRRLVADNLPLSPSEAELFWPVYERFQKDTSDLVDKRQEIIARLGENYDDMTDEVARQFTIDVLELQAARLSLIKSYFPKFEKVLPAKKLARYYQIEARIRAAVDVEIVERIPLIK
jgi:hypothetical protein